MKFVDAVYRCGSRRVWRDMGGGQFREVMVGKDGKSVSIDLWDSLWGCPFSRTRTNIELLDVLSCDWKFVVSNDSEPLTEKTEDNLAREGLEEKVDGLSKDIDLLIKTINARLSFVSMCLPNPLSQDAVIPKINRGSEW